MAVIVNYLQADVSGVNPSKGGNTYHKLWKPPDRNTKKNTQGRIFAWFFGAKTEKLAKSVALVSQLYARIILVFAFLAERSLLACRAEFNFE